MSAREFRFALRLIRKNPVFSVVAIVMLALGIGVSTLIFSIVEAVILRPLPYRAPNQLCMLWKSVPAKNIDWDWTSLSSINDWREQSNVFQDIAVVLRPEASRVILGGGPEPEKLQASKVSANLFSILGVAPALGRSFSEQEERLGENVAIVSYGFWKSRYAASSNVLGKTLEIDDHATTIIGVMPKEFQFPAKEVDLWLLASSDVRWHTFQTVRLADAFEGVGRLKPGISLEQAKSEMNDVAARVAAQHPSTDAGLGIRLLPITYTAASPQVRRALWLLLLAVLSVLCISCTNVANLLLARGAARQRELAVRSAMGAGYWRLVRQLVTESLALSITGGVLGVFSALLGIKILLWLSPTNLPNQENIRIDAAVLLFTFGLSVITGILFGIVPAWQQAKAAPERTLRESGRGNSGGATAGRTRGMLVASEFAIAFILLIGAGLLLRSFLRVQSVDLGFDPKNLLIVNIHLPPTGHESVEQIQAFCNGVLLRLNSLPGLQEASFGSVFSDHLANTTIIVEGRLAQQETVPNAHQEIGNDYFRVMGIPLRDGRSFSTEDRNNTTPVAVINEAMARQYWPGISPIGKRFQQVSPGFSGTPVWLSVVGVVGNVLRNGPESNLVPVVYRPIQQVPQLDLGIVIRTQVDPLSVSSSVKQAIRSVEQGLPSFEVRSAEQELDQLEAQRRFQTTMITGFAVFALALAAIGIYTLMHYTVTQRTKEIGIRIALGANRRHLLFMVLKQGMFWAVFGITIGLIGATLLTWTISSALYGVTPIDIRTFAGVTFILLCVAIAANSLPAYRATRVDPIGSLRYE